MSREPGARVGALRQAIQPGIMVVGLVAAGIGLKQAGLSDAIDHAGDHGPLFFAALGGVACAVMIPRQVVAYAAGLAFGFWAGFALALMAETLGCAANFFWARLLARHWAQRFLRQGRMARIDRFLRHNTFRATLTFRLLPLGSNVMLNVLAGASGVSAVPFIGASVLGYVPQTVVFTLLGSGVRVSAPLQLGLAAALLIGSVVLGVTLLRRRGGADPELP